MCTGLDGLACLDTLQYLFGNFRLDTLKAASVPAAGCEVSSPDWILPLDGAQQDSGRTGRQLSCGRPWLLENVHGPGIAEAVVDIVAVDALGIAVLAGSPDGEGVIREGDTAAEAVVVIGVGGLDVGLLATL